MSVLVAFSVTPLGMGDGVGRIVAEAVRVVRASGLPNQTDAVIKVDYRPGVSGALTAKVETVERYLSEPPQPDR